MAADIDALETLVGDKAVATQISEAFDTELKPIAKTGDIKDLTQTTGDYVVFDCGTASTVI
jgi:hypothetical protein